MTGGPEQTPGRRGGGNTTEAHQGRRRGGGRSLKTAAEALAALRLLGATEDGVTAEALALELGRSRATARYLLNTLCQEGFAARDRRTGTFRLQPAPPWGGSWGAGQACEPDGGTSKFGERRD